MALTNFVANITKVTAAWLNKIDVLYVTVFGEATTKALARTALTSDAPMAIVEGGTGAITAGAARTALGSTTVGDAVFIAATAAAARTAVGLTNDAAGRATIGAAALAGLSTQDFAAKDLAITGTPSSTKACAAGYIRVGPNLCMKTTTVSLISLGRDSLNLLTDPSSDSKALLVFCRVTVNAANGLAERTGNVNYGGAGLNTVQGGFGGGVYEFNATTAGTELGIFRGQFIIAKDTGYALQFADDAGDQGTAGYEIRGYFD